MKKTKTAVLASCLIAALATTSLFTPDLSSAGTVKGDINGDGSVNTTDIISMSRYLLGSGKANDSSALDMNGDGKINIIDYITLKKEILQAGTPVVTTAEVTTAKPDVTTTTVTTAKPAVTTAAVTTVKPAVTTAAVTTVKPAVTTATVTTVKPAVTTATVTTAKPAVSTAAVTTVKPVVTTPKTTTAKPAVSTAPVTTEKPLSTTAPVATTNAVTTTVTEKAKAFNIKTAATFEVTSTNLTNGVWDNVISNTSKGSNASPQLSWEPVENASCYAIYMIDTSARNWMHWKSANITETELKQGWAKSSEYVGPYPPSGTHKYEIYVFALKDSVSDMSGKFDDQNSGISTLAKSLDKTSSGSVGNIISYGHITGTYTK